MINLGEKLKKIRESNNLTQNQLAEIFFVSEKTISSWENNRTSPDLNMIYKISDYFKKSFFYLLNDSYDTDNINEIEIKLRVDNTEYNRILDLIKKTSINKNNVNQIDTYYSKNDLSLNNEWLRIRNEDGKYIFNYKKKINNYRFDKYDVLIDNANSLDKILIALGYKRVGTITKKRITYLYKGIYEFCFDILENIGTFIEIEFINKSDEEKNDLTNLLETLKELHINLNMVDQKKYIDYI